MVLLGNGTGWAAAPEEIAKELFYFIDSAGF
jgi:hypothetical protein